MCLATIDELQRGLPFSKTVPRQVVGTLAQPAVAAIRAIDPEQPVGDIRTMMQVLDAGLTSQRFSALLLGVFAGVALLSRRSRNLQRALLHRPRTQPRDRDQNRAWRADSRRSSSGDRRGYVADARRHRGRNDRRAGVGEGHGNVRLWCERISSADACCSRGHAGPCCLDGKPGAGVPCLTARPGESVARGLGIKRVLATRMRASHRARSIRTISEFSRTLSNTICLPSAVTSKDCVAAELLRWVSWRAFFVAMSSRQTSCAGNGPCAYTSARPFGTNR